MHLNEIEELRSFYESEGYDGVVRLIDLLSSPKGNNIYWIFAKFVGIHALNSSRYKTPESREAARKRLNSFGLGSESGYPTPLESLQDYMQGLQSCNKDSCYFFNMICSDFAEIGNGKKYFKTIDGVSVGRKSQLSLVK